MFHKPENPSWKINISEQQNGNRPQKHYPLALSKIIALWIMQTNFEKELLSCGKSEVLLVSSGVRLGAVKEDVHYLSVQRKWGESG